MIVGIRPIQFSKKNWGGDVSHFDFFEQDDVTLGLTKLTVD
jgi:hypothetical protein